MHSAKNLFVIQIQKVSDDRYSVEARFRGVSWLDHVEVTQIQLLMSETTKVQMSLDHNEGVSIPIRAYGAMLFDTLFADRVREGLHEAYTATYSGELCVVLQIPISLATIPWELTYDPDGIHGFLSLARGMTVRRQVENANEVNRLPREGPLRILVITAAIQSQRDSLEGLEPGTIYRYLSGKVPIWTTPLQEPRSQKSQKEPEGRGHNSKHRLRIDVLENATASSIRRTLARSHEIGQGYHVIHFYGRSQIEDDSELLVLEKDSADRTDIQAEFDAIDALEFANMITASTVNLVIFSIYQKYLPHGLSGGYAESIIKKGVPAVIYVQVRKPGRDFFASVRDLYFAFARRRPLERAVTEFRRSVYRFGSSASSVWGIPVLYTSSTQFPSRNHHIVPGRALSYSLAGARWFWAVFLSILAISGSLFGIPDFNRQIRTEIPLVRCILPYPMEVNGFNIVVAPFTSQTESGQVSVTADSASLSRILFRLFEEDLAKLTVADITPPTNIRGPDESCAVRGRSPEEREEAANDLIEKTNANVLIYGTIKQTRMGTRFSPEFYVSYKGFEEAVELTGGYVLGSSLPIEVPVSGQDFFGINDHPLIARSKALTLITFGLASYASDDIESALALFEQAEQLPGWSNRAGKEIIYLLLGNSRLRLSTQKKAPENLVNAIQYYDRALRLKPTYARAVVGKAGALYQMSLGDLENPSVKNINLRQLEQAEMLFRCLVDPLPQCPDTGLPMDAPDYANIPIKVSSGLGQIYLLKYWIFGGDWLGLAEDALNEVINSYESGNERSAELAGHAHARLGLIADRVYSDPLEAANRYGKAAELVTPYWKVRYYMIAGDEFLASGKIQLARLQFQMALDTAEIHGYSDYEDAAIRSLRKTE